MNKLKLNFNDLKVETFETSSVEASQGTVNGYNTRINNDCTVNESRNNNTCQLACTGNIYGSECGCPSGDVHCRLTGAYRCTYEKTVCYTEAGNYNC